MKDISEVLTLSIAIVTRNRPESLERTLLSLAKQNSSPFEVVVSDDSDSLISIEENKKLAIKYNCRYISGPQKGLYANRNFVAKNCVGTHIRSMDDDHEFPENHIQACIEAINSEKETIWTIGEYYPADKERPLPPPIPGQLHPRGFSYPPDNVEKYFGISCGASIYPRIVLDKGILNLESYKFGILYLEYGARLYNKGFKIRPLSTTYVIHHYDENNRSVSSLAIINSAEVFSMLMLSFYHQRSIKNQFLTTFQIIKEIIFGEYTYELVKSAYSQFKKEKTALKLQN